VLGVNARPIVAKVIAPAVRGLARAGVTPDMVTIAGQDNTVGQSIYLLPLNAANQLCVTATSGGGTLTIPEAPGFSLTVNPGQVTFPGGTQTGCVTVTVVHGDGAFGYPPSAPYERIILTVGAWDIAPAWGEQLAPQGRVVLPLTLLPSLMLSVALERVDHGFQSVSAKPCGFMPLRGVHAHPRTWEWAPPSVGMYPKTLPQPVGPNEIGIVKDWHQMIIRWPQYAARGEEHVPPKPQSGPSAEHL